MSSLCDTQSSELGGIWHTESQGGRANPFGMNDLGPIPLQERYRKVTGNIRETYRKVPRCDMINSLITILLVTIIDLKAIDSIIQVSDR